MRKFLLHTKTVLMVLMFLSMTVLGYRIIQESKKNQVFKKDSAELNHFKYGLFSVNAWKEKITGIISNEVDKLELDRSNVKLLRKHIQKSLAVLIDSMLQRMEQENLKTTGGKIKQTLIDGFIDPKELKQGIPKYAEEILREMRSPRTEAQIKRLLQTRIQFYLQESFDTRPMVEKDQIVSRYGEGSEEATSAMLKAEITRSQSIIKELSIVMMVLGALIFAMEGFSRKPLAPLNYLVLSLTLLVMLAVGITTPMIDMEAKISDLSFMLFDNPVQFTDQVLYFQSKSVMDVFQIMIRHRELQMKAVGILMVSFCLVFPLLKQLSSLAYYFNFGRTRNSKLINFFVSKSGKWSMADVLVVAIFMSYIGFNGIINSQLESMGSEGLDVLTTNGTSLQPGFYLFLVYTILAMFLSGFLKRRPGTVRRNRSSLIPGQVSDEEEIIFPRIPNEKKPPASDHPYTHH